MDCVHIFEILIFLERQSVHLLISPVSTVFFSYWNILQRYQTRKITLGVIFIMIERDALIAEKYDFHCEMAQISNSFTECFLRLQKCYDRKIGEDM